MMDDAAMARRGTVGAVDRDQKERERGGDDDEDNGDHKIEVAGVGEINHLREIKIAHGHESEGDGEDRHEDRALAR